ALANRAHAIERRHTNAGRKVAVGTTTDRDLLQGKAEIAGDSPRQFEQSDDSHRSLQRRPIDAAFNLDLAVLVHGTKLPNLALHNRAVFFVRNAKIHFGDGFGSDHVGPGSAADDSYIESCTSLQVGQLRNGQNLMSEFDDCALSFLEIKACVRSLTSDLDDERSDPFARGLQSASRPGWLAHQHRHTLLSHALSNRAGAFAASLFVGNQQHLHGPRKIAADFTHGIKSKYHLRNTALHVENARPIEPSVLLAPRHGQKRSQVVHGVEVPQQQQRIAIAGTAEIHFQVIACNALPMQLHLPANALESNREVRT